MSTESPSPSPIQLLEEKYNYSFVTSSQGTVWSRLWDDLTGACRCLPGSFGIRDGHRYIDIPPSFGPQGRFVLLWKVVSLAVGITTFILGFVVDPEPFFFAYITNWALLLSMVYSILSLINSVIPISQPPPGQTKVGWRCRLTWVTFMVAANSELVASIMWWTLIYDRGTTPKVVSVLSHGGVCAVIWIDGLIVNRIPIRLRHYWECTFWWNVLYIIWTVLQSGRVLALGNPDQQDEDPDTNDDVIYDALDWTEDPPKDAVLLTVVVLFVASPLVHAIMWAISKSGRRYVTNEDGSVNGSSSSMTTTNKDTNVDGTTASAEDTSTGISAGWTTITNPPGSDYVEMGAIPSTPAASATV